MTTVWQDDAACKGMDPDLFFTERGDSTSDPKAVCATCSVTAECLEDGLWERFGIWGGLSERERRKIRRSRPRPPTSRSIRCGTYGGYRRHLREGTPTCQPCRHANVLKQQLMKEQRSA